MIILLYRSTFTGNMTKKKIEMLAFERQRNAYMCILNANEEAYISIIFNANCQCKLLNVVYCMKFTKIAYKRRMTND